MDSALEGYELNGDLRPDSPGAQDARVSPPRPPRPPRAASLGSGTVSPAGSPPLRPPSAGPQVSGARAGVPEPPLPQPQLQPPIGPVRPAGAGERSLRAPGQRHRHRRHSTAQPARPPRGTGLWTAGTWRHLCPRGTWSLWGHSPRTHPAALQPARPGAQGEPPIRAGALLPWSLCAGQGPLGSALPRDVSCPGVAWGAG